MAVRIAVDAMGGDFAPGVIVRGAVEALADNDDFELVLVGDEGRVHAELRGLDLGPHAARVRVVHASQVIEMDESPVDGLRQKKDSSIVVMAKMAAAREVDAVISAGNTGACAAACQLKMRPLPNVSRAGIAVAVPSFHGPFVLCDVGANIQAKPRHLYEYGVMASVFAEKVIGIEKPRVAVLSIGEENVKGTELVKQTHELLSADSTIHFVGNVEGKDLFNNVCDVALCDGFVGNIVLKFVEGLAEGLFRTISHEFDGEEPGVKSKIDSALQRIWARHDYSEYGGAPLLGVDGVCIICHGRSNARAIRNAVRVAGQFLRLELGKAVVERLARPA
ncbi:MAG TPA: phosphate acyltransferase PlsX [Phycisphaerae bacterium]|jgi:glycerol-3-phosphate acyltransferase PlsX